MAEPSQDQTADDNSLDARLGGILSELQERIARGETIGEREVRAEYPECADQLLPVLGQLREIRDLQGVRHSPKNVEHLVERGLLASSSDPEYAAELGPYKITGLLGRGGIPASTILEQTA